MEGNTQRERQRDREKGGELQRQKDRQRRQTESGCELPQKMNVILA